MAEQIKIEGYGWKKQAPDWRDIPLALAPMMALPRHHTLYGKMPPVWNQGKLGSCTAHGTLRAYVMDRMKLGLKVFMPSRLLQYYDSRWLEGTTPLDAGATCRDAIKATAQWGACDEALWPYDTSKYARKPPPEAYEDAAKHQTIAYNAVYQDLYQLKATIFRGYGVAFGFTVYQNFEIGSTPHTGLMFLPEGSAIGGHCVCAVGWNSHNYIQCVNSWGNSFGDPDFPGSFWMPPEYILNPQLSSDFWTIQVVEND